MKTKTKILIFSIFIFTFLIIAPTSYALSLELQQPFGTLKNTIDVTGVTLGTYLAAAYGFGTAVIAALAIVMIIIGGVQWIMSGGSPDKIGQAKDRIFKAFLGLFIALFSVFILQTVSPATVNLSSITPAALENVICCDLNNQKFHTTDSDCQAKGGQAVDANKCVGDFQTTEQAVSGTCNAINPRASCFAEKCTDLKRISSDGECKDATKPYCCAEAGTPKECKDAAGCEKNQYCASAGPNKPGLCYDKRSSGMNCQEMILGSTSGDLLGGGPDEVCISDRCYGGTSAGINKCVPQNGTGSANEYCTDKLQCKSGHCYKGNNENAKEGLCVGNTRDEAALKFLQKCQNRNIDAGGFDDDSPCPGDYDGNGDIWDNCGDIPGHEDICGQEEIIKTLK